MNDLLNIGPLLLGIAAILTAGSGIYFTEQTRREARERAETKADKTETRSLRRRVRSLERELRDCLEERE